jgi:bile acid:Na+ symporter, BASS family
MLVDRLINFLATITLFEMMISIGLGVSLPAVISVLKDTGLVVRVMFANYVLVPAVALALIVWFHPAPMPAAGFLVAAVCPGAPYGPPLTSMAKGNVTLAVGLMVLLAGSSAILAPILLGHLLSLITQGLTLKLDVLKVLTALLGAQLFPLGIGLLIRHRQPSLADRLQRPARLISLALNLITLAVILSLQGRMLSQIHLRGYIGMLCLVLMSMAAGWVTNRHGENPKGMVIATSVRNVGVALVIVSASFPGTAAITSATIYALFQTIAIALFAFTWGRLTAGTVSMRKSAA